MPCPIHAGPRNSPPILTTAAAAAPHLFGQAASLVSVTHWQVAGAAVLLVLTAGGIGHRAAAPAKAEAGNLTAGRQGGRQADRQGESWKKGYTSWATVVISSGGACSTKKHRDTHHTHTHVYTQPHIHALEAAAGGRGRAGAPRVALNLRRRRRRRGRRRGGRGRWCRGSRRGRRRVGSPFQGVAGLRGDATHARLAPSHAQLDVAGISPLSTPLQVVVVVHSGQTRGRGRWRCMCDEGVHVWRWVG